MADNPWSMLTEYRHWRASVPAGIMMGATITVYTVGRWPVLLVPKKAFAPELIFLGQAAGRSGLLFLAFLASVMLGSALCELISGIVVRLQVLTLSRLPLELTMGEWSILNRLMCPLPLSALGAVQRAMKRTDEYRDLEACDQRGAYVSVFKEALKFPSVARADSGMNQEILRSQTDVRLLSGLLITLPLLVFELSRHLLRAAHPLANVLRSMSWLIAAILLIGLVLAVRRCNDLAAQRCVTDASLGRHARAAINWGRTRPAVEEAERYTE